MNEQNKKEFKAYMEELLLDCIKQSYDDEADYYDEKDSKEVNPFEMKTAIEATAFLRLIEVLHDEIGLEEDYNHYQMAILGMAYTYKVQRNKK